MNRLIMLSPIGFIVVILIGACAAILIDAAARASLLTIVPFSIILCLLVLALIQDATWPRNGTGAYRRDGELFFRVTDAEERP